MKILGIDPGGTTGYSLIQVKDKEISPIAFGETKDKLLLELVPFLQEADIIVYENFLLRPGMARSGAFDWKSNTTEQVIGSLKTLAALHGKEIAKPQEPAQKPIGYGFANLKYIPGRKGTHWQDAHAHAVYYAVTKLKANPVRPTS
jgi:hypothetical protein